MAKKANPTPSRTCADCFHFSACHLWAVSISTDVAPQCPQFEPARYASLADLHEMHQMAKGELVPVVRCRECKHAIVNEKHSEKPLICCLTKMCGTTKEDWFCADGEREMDGGAADV